jgi:flagellar motility protein MotE (MotC chaperone)
VIEKADWTEARLYIQAELGRLSEELRKVSAELAIAREKQEGKQKQDLDKAHEKIRALEKKASAAKLKQWAASAAASFLAVVVIELLKRLLR